MKKWFALVKKEFRQINILIVVSVLIIAAWEIFLLTRGENWPPGVTFGLGFIPLFFLPVIMLYLGYSSYRKEWENDTIYFLKTLPRKGYEINSAKFISAFLYFALISMLTLYVHLFFHQEFMSWMIDQMPAVLNAEIIVQFLRVNIIMYLTAGIQLYLITQLAYLTASFFARFRLLISIVVFILAHYLLYRVGGMIALILNFLPDFPITIMMESPAGVEAATVYLGSGPIAAVIILLSGIFWFNSRLIGREVDI